MSNQKKRKYQLRKRAEAMEDTRRRITEAAVELHGSVGPARTTVTAVAERAGVQRHTVYRHFPTEEDLFAACSGHFYEANPLPDPEAWTRISDPKQRLETALDDLYRYYERTEKMTANVFRDAELVPAIPAALAPFLAYLQDVAHVLAAGWPARGARRRVVIAAIRHAVDFRTWQTLIRDGGIARAQGITLAVALVERASNPAR